MYSVSYHHTAARKSGVWTAKVPKQLLMHRDKSRLLHLAAAAKVTDLQRILHYHSCVGKASEMPNRYDSELHAHHTATSPGRNHVGAKAVRRVTR